jgi:hypothetical protein
VLKDMQGRNVTNAKIHVHQILVSTEVLVEGKALVISVSALQIEKV